MAEVPTTETVETVAQGAGLVALLVRRGRLPRLGKVMAAATHLAVGGLTRVAAEARQQRVAYRLVAQEQLRQYLDRPLLTLAAVAVLLTLQLIQAAAAAGRAAAATGQHLFHQQVVPLGPPILAEAAVAL